MFIQDRQNIGTQTTITSKRVDDKLHGAINIPALLGPRSWSRLPLAVRNRFAIPVRAGEVITYRGTMHKVTASRFGKVMAWISRFAGAPVAHKTGLDIPCEVNLFHDVKRGGTVWERVYHFGAKTICARTTKKAASDGTSLECFGSAFGFGTGMTLAIFEADTALHFVSRAFFIQFLNWRIPLPKFLNPGQLVVTHRDLGDGAFQFLMIVTHPKLGEIMFQDGTFHDPD